MKNLKFNTLDIIALSMFAYAVFNFFNGNRNILRYQEEKRKMAQLEYELNKSEKIYQRTVNEINNAEHTEDSDYVDEILKDKLNYKKKKETVFQYKKLKTKKTKR